MSARLRIVASVGLAAIAWTAAAHAADAPRRAKDPGAPYAAADRVVAVVNEDVVTLRDLDRAVGLQRTISEYVQTEIVRPQTEAEQRRAVLDALIDLLLCVQEAKRVDRLNVADTEVDREVARVKGANGWSDVELEETVRKIGFASLAEYRESVRREILRVKVLNYKVGGRLRVTEADVDKVISEEYEGGTSELEVHASHVLIRVPEIVSATELRRLRDLALSVREQALAGKVPFVDLALKYSGDPGAKDGDIGWHPRGRLEPAFEGALFKLKDGEVSPVTQTPYGFHVIKALGHRRAAVTNKDELKGRVYARLTQAAFVKTYGQWISEQRASAHIDIRL